MSTFRAALACLLCIASLTDGPAIGQDAQSLRVDRQDAELLHVIDGWAIWRTSQPIEKLRFNRNSFLDFKIYRQRIPDPIASLVMHRTTGAGFNPCQAVAEDGTLITLSSMGKSVVWYRPDGTIEESSKVSQDEKLLRAYQVGVLLEKNRIHVNEEGAPTLERTLYYVPLQGKMIDLDKRAEIRLKNVWRYQYEPVRSGHVMVWNTQEGLRRLDLKTGEQTSVSIEDAGTQFNLRGGAVSAFDGQLVLLGSNVVVDSRTGKRVATNWDDERINSLIMTHAGIGYRVVEGKMEAIDLERTDQPPVVLVEAAHLPIAKTPTGILLWTGEKWKTVPWYISPIGANGGRTKP